MNIYETQAKVAERMLNSLLLGKTRSFGRNKVYEKQNPPVILVFGKYKGWDLEKLLDHDPSYCKWLYGLPDAKKYIRQYAILDKRLGTNN